MEKPIKILIVDDNLDDRELYVRELRNGLGSNIDLYEAGNGDCCLKQLEQLTPDCILLDYSLPGRNGLEVLKRIRVHFPLLPVVMLTGQGNEAIAVQAMKQGAQDYVIKSEISSSLLAYVVSSAIQKCKLQEKLESQQEALSLFTQALAHDLKEPLRTIQSYTDLIRSSSLSSEQAFFMGRVKNAANGMIKLIKTVQSYTAISSSENFAIEKCDLNNVVYLAISNLGTHFDNEEIDFNIGELPIVYYNEAHLIQIFQNLINNSIQNFGQNKNKKLVIEIQCREHKEFYQICVKDNGPGIKSDYLKTIFEPFKRYSITRSGGSGLGLAISKKIVENEGGKIWCESEVSLGAAFYFTILKSRTKERVKNIKDFARPNLIDEVFVKNKPANILLVDDSIDYITLFRFLILKNEKIEFNLHTVNNGREAVEFLTTPENPKINLILLDISMPVMDGFEFLEYRKKSENIKSIPVIMCSTSDYDKDIQQAKCLGVNDYLVKPVSKDSLMKSLKNITGLCAVENGDQTLIAVQ